MVNMVDSLWRHILPALSSMLVRAAGWEALTMALVRAYQSYIYAAGVEVWECMSVELRKCGKRGPSCAFKLLGGRH